MTEIVVLLLIRTVRPVFKSKPSAWLLWTSLGTLAITLLLPYLALGQKVGLQPLPLPLLGFMVGIAVLYGFLVETTKKWFFKKGKTRLTPA